MGGAYQALSVRLIPCAASVVTIDGKKLGGASENDDCVWDQEEVNSYLGYTINMLVYTNQREFK